MTTFPFFRTFKRICGASNELRDSFEFRVLVLLVYFSLTYLFCVYFGYIVCILVSFLGPSERIHGVSKASLGITRKLCYASMTSLMSHFNQGLSCHGFRWRIETQTFAPHIRSVVLRSINFWEHMHVCLTSEFVVLRKHLSIRNHSVIMWCQNRDFYVSAQSFRNAFCYRSVA